MRTPYSGLRWGSNVVSLILGSMETISTGTHGHPGHNKSGLFKSNREDKDVEQKYHRSIIIKMSNE